MALDGWLVQCHEDIGFRSGPLTVNAMAFADDMIVVAATSQGLQEQLDDLHSVLKSGARNQLH